MTWPDGTYYEGYWNLGYAEGVGELQYANTDFMKGEFRYNKLNGYGECYHSELGYSYKGNWENDLQIGMGCEIWQDGSFYIGHYEFGKKEGFGKYQWTDSSYYIGEWKDNKIHGYVFTVLKKGVYYWADGRKFAGEWKNSKMNGYGLFTWKDGRSYRGTRLPYLRGIQR
jgi:hypothetical protein